MPRIHLTHTDKYEINISPWQTRSCHSSVAGEGPQCRSLSLWQKRLRACFLRRAQVNHPDQQCPEREKKDHPEIEPMLQIWAAELRSKALLEVPVVDHNSNLGIRGGLAMERSIIKIMLCSLNRNFSTCNTYIL